MDSLYLFLSGCSPSDLLQTLGPYLGNLIRRRSSDGLWLLVDPGPNFFSIGFGDAREGDMTREEFAMVEGTMSVPPGEEADKLWFDTITHIPLEKVFYLTMPLPILRSEELCVRMRNLIHLRPKRVDLSTWFTEPDIHEPHVFKDLLPRLRSISIFKPPPEWWRLEPPDELPDPSRSSWEPDLFS
jgi:hypothetical protein